MTQGRLEVCYEFICAEQEDGGPLSVFDFGCPSSKSRFHLSPRDSEGTCHDVIGLERPDWLMAETYASPKSMTADFRICVDVDLDHSARPSLTAAYHTQQWEAACDPDSEGPLALNT